MPVINLGCMEDNLARVKGPHSWKQHHSLSDASLELDSAIIALSIITMGSFRRIQSHCHNTIMPAASMIFSYHRFTPPICLITLFDLGSKAKLMTEALHCTPGSHHLLAFSSICKLCLALTMTTSHCQRAASPSHSGYRAHPHQQNAIPCAEIAARAASQAYREAITHSERTHLNSIFAAANEERNHSRNPFVEDEEFSRHPIQSATCTRHTLYCRAIEIHWLTCLFIAQAFRSKDGDCLILLTEISEIKEEIGDLKEALHIIGRKLGVYPFLIRMDEAGPSNSAAVTMEEVPVTPRTAT